MMDMNSNNNMSPAAKSRYNLSLPAWLSGAMGFWVLLAGIYAVIYSAWILFKWTDPAYEELIAGWGYLPLGIFSAAASVYTSRRKNLDPRVRRAWGLIAVSYIALALGDIVYVTIDLTRGIGLPDIPDFFYLISYPLLFAGVTYLPTRLSDPSQKKTWGFDLAILISSVTGMLWYFIIAPTAETSGEDWFTRIVAGAYPAMDALILAGIASLLFRRSEPSVRQSLFILGLGMVAYITADIIYAWQVFAETYFSGSYVDLLWSLSYFMVGLAAVRQAVPFTRQSDNEDEKSNVLWRASILPFAAVIASTTVTLYVSGTGLESNLQTNGLLVGTAIAIFALILRQLITNRENSRLVEELNSATEKLLSNAGVLEERVRERTQKLERQTRKLELAAQISRDVTAVNQMESLLKDFSTGIMKGFDLYHTGIYLLDNQREYLVMVASGSEAGQQMVTTKAKMQLRDNDMVVRAVAAEEPILAFHPDPAIMTDHPLLPDTRSRIALPLKVERRVIGVLDVQSTNTNAFEDDDIKVMQVIADQLASAIERTRLLEESSNNLRELELAYGSYTREGWRKFTSSSRLRNRGYRFDNIRIEPIVSVNQLGQQALTQGKSVHAQNSAEGNEIAIPIKFRGQTIGVVNAKLREGYAETTISTLELAIDRLASTMESARLYEEAKIRADREQAIAQVTSAISLSSDFETILKTTVREIGNALNDAEVAIRIAGDADLQAQMN